MMYTAPTYVWLQVARKLNKLCEGFAVECCWTDARMQDWDFKVAKQHKTTSLCHKVRERPSLKSRRQIFQRFLA